MSNMLQRMMPTWRRICIAALMTIAACGKNNEPPPPSTGGFNPQQESGPSRPRVANDASAMTAARALYGTLCVSCHGATGHGDGPMATTLEPKPRNYSDPAWQASVSDDDIKAIIVKGGAGVGKSKWMPGQPDLAGSPKLDMLVRIIRGFGQAPANAAPGTATPAPAAQPRRAHGSQRRAPGEHTVHNRSMRKTGT